MTEVFSSQSMDPFFKPGIIPVVGRKRSASKKHTLGMSRRTLSFNLHFTWHAAKPELAQNSGCGVIFRENEKQGYLVVFTIGDQAVLYRWVAGAWIKEVVSKRFKVDEVVATANIILVANGPSLFVFVDGVEILNRVLAGLGSGSLAFTVIANSTDDNEVGCEMSNTALWEIIP